MMWMTRLSAATEAVVATGAKFQVEHKSIALT